MNLTQVLMTFQVVMAVAQLYHHCAPKSEVGTVAKALIRLLRSHKYGNYSLPRW